MSLSGGGLSEDLHMDPQYQESRMGGWGRVFYTPERPQNLRAQESAWKDLWGTKDSDSSGLAYGHWVF